MCRKQCSECPHKVKNNHNDKFLKNVKMMTEKNIIDDGNHTCHMIKPGWDKPNDSNICIGSIK